MKHLRHLFIVLLLLFVSATTMAQTRNENTEKNLTEWSTRADVNGDGIVNMQDVLAIIAIMQKAGGVSDGKTNYYWYAGQTQPTSLTTNPTPSAEFTCNNWFEIGTTLPTSIVQRVTGGVSGNIWYAAVPSSANLRPTATDNTTTDTSITKLGNITVNNIQYDVWKAAGVTATRYTAIFNK